MVQVWPFVPGQGQLSEGRVGCYAMAWQVTCISFQGGDFGLWNP